MALSSTPVSIPFPMTTTQRNALGTSLPPATQIFNSTTLKYEYTIDGGSNWLQITTGTPGAQGLNANYLVDPNITYDGSNPVRIGTSTASQIAYTAPPPGIISPGSYLWGFKFTPTVSGFITSLQYPDLLFSQPGPRLVQIWRDGTAPNTQLMLSGNVLKTDLLVSGFRTNRNIIPTFLFAGVQYWCSVVVPASEGHNQTVIAPIAPITISESRFTASSTPGIPTTLFLAASCPSGGGFEFIDQTTYNNTLFSNNVLLNDALFSRNASLNNQNLNVNHGFITFQEAINNVGWYPSILASMITDSTGGINNAELVTVSANQDFACRRVLSSDIIRTPILGTAFNTTTAAGQVQYIHGLRVMQFLSGGVITRGDILVRSGATNGRVTNAGAGGNGSCGVALQSVAAAGTVFLGAELKSMT